MELSIAQWIGILFEPVVAVLILIAAIALGGWGGYSLVGPAIDRMITRLRKNRH